MKLYLLSLVFVLGCCVLSAQEPIKNISDVISVSEFERSGLQKLTKAELNELSGALFGWKEAQIPVKKAKLKATPKETAFGAEKIEKKSNPDDPKFIVSTIEGEFRGWSGKTVFRLSNGQVWRQVRGKSLKVKLMNPQVTIKKSAMGSFTLKVEGFRTGCKVTRVK